LTLCPQHFTFCGDKTSLYVAQLFNRDTEIAPDLVDEPDSLQSVVVCRTSSLWNTTRSS